VTSRRQQKKKKQQEQSSADMNNNNNNINGDAMTQDHFMNVGEVLQMEMEEKDNGIDQTPILSSINDSEVVSTRKPQNGGVPFFGERFAYNMRVNNIIVHCGSNVCSASASGGTVGGSTEDMIYSIASNWKRQAMALALPPAATLDYYKRQYEQLCTVLSISLFNHPPDSTPLLDATAAAAAAAADKQKETSTTDKNVPTPTSGGKRKRNAPTQNDYEFIIFEKNGKYIFKRVESADKYAKRNKPVQCYICILPIKEEYRLQTRECMAKLRNFDSKFVVGNEIIFDGPFSELYKEVVERIAHISYDRFSRVEYKEKNIEDTDETMVDGTSKISSPPVKKAKVELPKVNVKFIEPNSVQGKRKKKSKKAEDELRRSGIEDFTDSDTDYDEEPKDNRPTPVYIPTPKPVLEVMKKPNGGKEVRNKGEGATESIFNFNNVANRQELERPPSPFLERPGR
jgi:hypothetical protein